MLDSFYFHYKCKEVLQRFLNNSIKKKFLSVLSSFEMLWYLNSISLDNKKNILVIFLEELVCFSSIPSVSTRLGERHAKFHEFHDLSTFPTKYLL